MIDLINAKKEFDKFVSNYNPENPRIALKIGHIERVVNVSQEIAKNLNLSKEEIKLAMLIGYFHDLGRFEQVRRTNSFSDRDTGLNHAELSVKILFENGLIRNFIIDTKYDEIIKKAVLNHNKPYIEENLSEKELLFSKIIRDSDKLDIFYTITFDTFPAIFWYEGFDSEKIDDIVMNEYESGSFINYDNINNNADMILAFYGYVYDLNFPVSLKYLVDKKYMEIFKTRLLEHFSSPIVKKQIEHVHSIYHNYINSKTLK